MEKTPAQIDQETKQYVEQLPPRVVELWRMRKESRIAPLLGIGAVGEVSNLSGFTRYCERVLEGEE